MEQLELSIEIEGELHLFTDVSEIVASDLFKGDHHSLPLLQ